MEKEAEQQRKVEAEREKQIREDHNHAHNHQDPPPNISSMKPITHGAYGGGMYGTDDRKGPSKPPASETQSADGPVDSTTIHLKSKPPPSSGDRDIDITGQSYIQ